MTYLDKNDEKIGKRVKQERILNGLTIAELSQRCGISIVTISRIENGQVHARLCNLQKIAESLNTTLEKLIK